MTTEFYTAGKILATPMQMYWIKSQSRKVLDGYSFVPVCQYPVGYEVEKKEVGMLAKLGGDGQIGKIRGRVFVTGDSHGD